MQQSRPLMWSSNLRLLPQLTWAPFCRHNDKSQFLCFHEFLEPFQNPISPSNINTLPWSSWLALYILNAHVQRVIIFLLHILFLIFYIASVTCRRKNAGRKPNPRVAGYGVSAYFKMVRTCCLYVSAINFGVLLFWIFDGFRNNWSSLPVEVLVASATQSVAWCVMYMATEEARQNRRQYFSTLLRAWWIFAFLVATLTFLSSILMLTKKGVYHWAVGVEIALYPAILVVGYAGLRGYTGLEESLLGDGTDSQEPLLNGRTDSELNSEENFPDPLYKGASYYSLATFVWLNPILAVGKMKALELPDIPLLPEEDSTAAEYESFKKSWEELEKEHPMKTPTISLAVWKSHRSRMIVNAFFALVNVVSSYVGPFFINDFVEYLGGRRRFEYEGMTLVTLLFFAKVIENLAMRQWYYGIQFICLRVKAALTVVVYRKALRLSSIARQNHTSGEIINYMSVDVQRVSDFGWYLHQVWILPIEVALSLSILYKVVGMAWIAAFVAACVTLFLNTPLEKMQEKYQNGVMAAKDTRMKALAECLRNMRVLKLQAWEQRFLSKIEELRRGEYGWLLKDCIARAFAVYIFWLAPILIAVATFGTCVLMSIPLTPGRVLSAIATFRVLQDALSQFPEVVSFYAQTKVSLDRILAFLQEEELPQDAVIHVPKEDCGGIAIKIEGGEFSWSTSRTEMKTLADINLLVKHGSRVAVCGTVGSGKTSLLSCILGEIPKLAGTVQVAGTTAYVSQSAWIQTGKVEDNVRFGSPMDQNRYKAVLNACALKKDLELWAFGDQTEIGEHGINMSGGQKQRIQLARALYQDSDIYLLDDPFSAVDAHTGSELFKECILGMLASKTVVYVTHQMEFLPAADLILVLDKGRIVQAGKYEDLLQAGTNFQSLVNAHNEAIDGMDVNEQSEDGSAGTPGTNGEVTNGVEIYHSADAFQWQRSLRKSGSGSMRKQSSKREDNHQEALKRQLIEEEELERGSVSFSVYWSYATAVYKGALVFVIIGCQIGFLVLQVGSNYWMTWATPIAEEGRMTSRKLILVFTALSFASSLFVVVRSLAVSLAGVLIAQTFFLDMIRCIFRAPMSFFDSTPAGRILNRASSDQSKLDTEIQYFMSSVIVTTVQLLGVVALLAQISWTVLLFFLPVAAACIWMQRYYMTSAREVSRLQGVEKSPIINHYGESIAGAATIRGFGQYHRFIDTNIQLFDNYSRPAFLQFALIEWLCFRMELLCTLVFAFSMILVVSLPNKAIDPSLSGLAVTYGLNLNILIGWWMWNLCNVETNIISVERIQQYTNITSEADLIIEQNRPPSSWPLQGTIELRNLQIRYSMYSPLVLHGVTCTFHGGKKIGVVGRTGSGKSTLIQAMFRMVEPAGGKIVIDGLDITTIGLHDLRSRLSIIPQDPTLFEGTMRTNLDPLEEHTDLEVWEALDKCQLGDVVRAKDGKLDAIVGENADNWSVGQRQLVCMGRALLKRTRILVLDEATASVDSATDNVIQRTLRTEFKDCTVVTIAHRIPTVVDSDRVLVLSDGRIAEYDVPLRLLENKDSLFARLVAEYTVCSTNSTSTFNGL